MDSIKPTNAIMIIYLIGNDYEKDARFDITNIRSEIVVLKNFPIFIIILYNSMTLVFYLLDFFHKKVL